MSKVRVYELATQLGVDVPAIAERARQMGFSIESGHLAQLTGDQAAKLKDAFRDQPAGNVQQKRVQSTVIRRRRRGGPAPAETPAPAAAPVRRARVVATPRPEPPVIAAAPATPKAAAKAQPVAVAKAAPTAAAPAVAPVTAAPQDPAAPAKVLTKEEVAARTDTKWGSHKVSRVATVEVDDSPQSLVKVVRRLDPSLTKNIIAQQQQQRPTGPPRGRVRPGGRGPMPGRPGGPGAGGPARPLPGPGGPARTGAPGAAPGAAPTGDKAAAGKKRRGGGRVAYDRQNDRGFDRGRGRGRGRGKKVRRTGGATTEITVPKASKRVVKMEDAITVADLAVQLSVKANEIIMYLMRQGEMVTVNHVLDIDTVTIIAQEYQFTVENVAFDIEHYIAKGTELGAGEFREPIVTVMGHVDHGKTSLLDYIRRARVAAGEAGGITQHIGAYKVPVEVNGEKKAVVFLDTPGHAAFSAMRARGAQVTDITVLVVAADDGVMPQTIESINHSKAAGVPIVVAVNKCDKEEADPERVRRELTEHGVVPEEWGGDTQFIDLSAHTGDGVDALLESIILQSELLELSAVREGPAQGVIVEAALSRGRGPVATVLVTQGTIRKGDIVVAGKAMGRVRALVDDHGRQIASAGPSTPVEILGLSEAPPPSEMFYVVKDEKNGRQIVSHLEDKERQKRLANERKKVSLDDLFEQMEAGETKTLALIIKSDVQGSLEALKTAFDKLQHPELEVRIIHSGVGPVSESDVTLASASQAIIIGFNIRPEKKAKALADHEGVEVKLYSIIYEAVDDVMKAMEGLLDPKIEERFLGKADVREVFTIPKMGTIAGCAVLQGKLQRDQHARLVRDGRVIYTGKVQSLRRFKADVKDVDRGHECGARLENYADIKVGDEIECFELIEVAQKLELTAEI